MLAWLAVQSPDGDDFDALVTSVEALVVFRRDVEARFLRGGTWTITDAIAAYRALRQVTTFAADYLVAARVAVSDLRERLEALAARLRTIEEAQRRLGCSKGR
jgi:hypothetical protein